MMETKEQKLEMRDHFFMLKVFVPTEVSCSEDRLRWYFDHAIRGYHRDFALESDHIRKMSGCIVYAEKVALKDAHKPSSENASLLSVQKQLLEALEEAEGFVDRHSEDWYTAGQELLKKMRAAILAAKASS